MIKKDQVRNLKMVSVLILAMGLVFNGPQEAWGVGRVTPAVQGSRKKEAVSKPELILGRKVLQRVESRYRSIKTGATATVKKVTKLKLLEQERMSTGKLWLKPPGRLRLELISDQMSLFLVESKKIWVVEFQDKLGQVPLSVATSKSPKQLQSQALSSFLLGSNSVLAQYNLIEFTKVKSPPSTRGLFRAKLVEKGQSASSNNWVLIEGDQREGTLLALEFQDEIGNNTRYEFSEIDFSAKLGQDLFKFKVPDGIDVTEL